MNREQQDSALVNALDNAIGKARHAVYSDEPIIKAAMKQPKRALAVQIARNIFHAEEEARKLSECRREVELLQERIAGMETVIRLRPMK